MEGKRTINSIGLFNILSFSSGGQEIELQPLNVLIGPNASGKSNFIEVIRLLQALPTNPARVIREGGGVEEWLWKGQDHIAHGVVQLQLEQKNFGKTHYDLNFSRSGYYWEITHEYVQTEAPNLGFRRKGELARDTSFLAVQRDEPSIAAIAETFSSIGIYKDWNNSRFSPLRSPQRPDLPARPLLEDLSNFGLVFNNLPSSIKLGITEQLRQVYDGVEEIRTPIDGGAVQIWIQEQGLSSPTPAARVSDGTLRYLFLLTLLKQPDPPPLICLEEPEMGLHPDLIHSVAELLIEASQRTQLIVTTHSSSLISALSNIPESVIVCERGSSGTTLRRLDRESLEGWLERYELGELWEKGVIGGTR
ncbi:MAG: AAA family ATPase [Acidobacteria bacterium]|nr:AAA family ATPase [Acidobacteriota bacterium]